jgi:hypothetical protein
MRGCDNQQSGMFSYALLEDRVPQGHPLRAIRKTVGGILQEGPDIAIMMDVAYACSD